MGAAKRREALSLSLSLSPHPPSLLSSVSRTASPAPIRPPTDGLHSITRPHPQGLHPACHHLGCGGVGGPNPPPPGPSSQRARPGDLATKKEHKFRSIVRIFMEMNVLEYGEAGRPAGSDRRRFEEDDGITGKGLRKDFNLASNIDVTCVDPRQRAGVCCRPADGAVLIPQGRGQWP